MHVLEVVVVLVEVVRVDVYLHQNPLKVLVAALVAVVVVVVEVVPHIALEHVLLDAIHQWLKCMDQEEAVEAAVIAVSAQVVHQLIQTVVAEAVAVI